MRLARLFSPRTVAVIGGGAWCSAVLEQLDQSRFGGAVWHVHPKAEGAYRAVDELPEPPDAVFLGVNRNASLSIVAQLAEMGAGGVVCFAAGFSEMAAEDPDAPALEAVLIEAAGAMPVLGPNCYGFINAFDDVLLWPDQHGLVPTICGVALICQSSNVALNLTMQSRGLPIGFVGTVGNQACVSLAEMGAQLIADKRVTALGLFVEGFGSVAELEGLAQMARAYGKTIVATKIGASETARAAAVSHTASLAGSDAGAAALLARLGIARAPRLEVFLEALKIAHLFGRLPAPTLATASCSGGEAGLAADLGAGLGVTFPPLTADQTGGLRDALGPSIALANPLDYNTFVWRDVPAMSAAFAALATGEQALTLVVADFPRADRCDPKDWACVTEAIIGATAQSGARFGLVSSLAEGLPEAVSEALLAAGVLPMSGLAAALEAVGLMGAVPDPSPLPVAPVRAHGDGRVLLEAEAKALLSAAKSPRGASAGSPEAAAALAEEIGFPVVLKGEGLAHKTEAGAVRLGLESAQEVADAAAQIGAARFWVEEMVTDAVAELLVGVVADPAHGYVLTLAAGGILTELLADTAQLLVPVEEADVRGALGRLRLAPVFFGYRGQPPADLDAIVAAVMAVQEVVLSREDVLEVEINPLICGQKGAVAVDALVRLGEKR